jgi:hypothetical protein
MQSAAQVAIPYLASQRSGNWRISLVFMWALPMDRKGCYMWTAFVRGGLLSFTVGVTIARTVAPDAGVQQCRWITAYGGGYHGGDLWMVLWAVINGSDFAEILPVCDGFLASQIRLPGSQSGIAKSGTRAVNEAWGQLRQPLISPI